MAITISGENNNDRILAQDGVIDSISGFNIAGIITASSFTGDLTGDVTGDLTGNVTGNINNTTLLLQTGGSERVRIASNGKVGVGVNPINYPGIFVVSGDALICDRDIHSRVANSVANSDRGFKQDIDGTEKLHLYSDNSSNIILEGNGGNEKLRIMSGGAIGINTTTGTNTVNIGGVAGLGFKFHNFTSGNSSYITVESGDKLQSNVGGSGYYTWVTGGSEKVRIDSSGNMQVSAGQFTVGTTGSTGLQFINDGTFGTIHSADLKFRTTATERLRITSGGSVNIGGDYSQTSQKLKVTGNTTIDGTLTAGVGFVCAGGFSIFSGNVTQGGYTFHDADSNTYFGFPGADQFDIFTAGSSRMHIHSDGRFRVGCTAQPSGTVGGFQLDMGSYPGTMRLMSGAGASGTESATIAVGGSNHNSNIENGANSGGKLDLYNYNSTDGNSSAISFLNSNGLSVSRILGLNVSHSSRNGALVFMVSSGSHPTERLRIISGGSVLVNKTTTSDHGKFEVKGGTADNIETADITAKTIATFSGSTPGTTAAGKGAGIVIKPIADRGCNYFLGVANSSANQEAHGSFIIRSGNFAGTTSERLRINSSGELQISGNCEPAADTTYDLGANTSNRWRNIYGQTLSLTSYAVMGSLVVNDPGSSYYSFNNRIGGNSIIKGTTVCTDNIHTTVPNTFPASNVQLMVYTSTNGQPISNTDCARLLIATDAKQTGAQGYNGALDFGNSDCSAAGSGAEFNWRLASIMSNAGGDTSSTIGDGDLQFWTKTSSGSLTRRVEIKANGDIAFNNCTNTINSSNYGLYLLNDSDSTKSIYFRHSREANGTHSTAEFHGNQGRMEVMGDGDVRNTNNSYGSLSDVTLKQDIVDASSQWNDIKAIKVRKFRFKDNPTGDLQIGVVAQEVETVSPKLVKEVATSSTDLNSTETVKAVKYSILYMKAIKALQEAQERIETLEAKVDALEGA